VAILLLATCVLPASCTCKHEDVVCAVKATDVDRGIEVEGIARDPVAERDAEARLSAEARKDACARLTERVGGDAAYRAACESGGASTIRFGEVSCSTLEWEQDPTGGFAPH
jgi:hypothetical protein